ncbi:MAG: GWxTD domain-containing protein [Urechidicola sp.]|jgi:GWxTD domain-containing protein
MNKLTSISIFRVAFVFTMLAIFVGCNTNKIIPQETNYQYDNKINDLNPKYLVYHTNDSLSYLYLEIATKELLYVRESSKMPFESEVKFSYEIYEDYKGKVLIDSDYKVFYDYKTEVRNKRILARVPLAINYGSNAIIKIIAYDVNKKIQSESVLEVNKSDNYSEQFFLLKQKLTGNVCFNSYISSVDSLTVESDYNRDEDFMVDFFNTNYPASIPPFSRNRVVEIPQNRDSLFLLSIENKLGGITLDKQGSYFIRSIDSSNYCLTLQKLDSNFNSFYNYMGMIGPLKYICTSGEYTALSTAENKREAVERFWLRVGGSKERARVVIEEYYRRVELANKFFTSYKEGWKTDRGMLSIVMGLPKTIYKTNNGETWIYGTPNNMMMSLTFNFNKENTDKNNNDYQLVRYRTYRDYWYRACESWRQGRIYNYN